MVQAFILIRSIMRPGVHTATCNRAGAGVRPVTAAAPGWPLTRAGVGCTQAPAERGFRSWHAELVHAAQPHLELSLAHMQCWLAQPVQPQAPHLTPRLQVLALLVLVQAAKRGAHRQAVRLAKPACTGLTSFGCCIRTGLAAS